MPWETKTVNEQRAAFVAAVERGEGTVSSLCRAYGISRKTGYKWIHRAALGQQLCDQSRCPHLQPSKTARETEQLILDVRASNPAWGGRTIKAVLEAAGCEGIPSAKTCSNILKRNGCIDPLESKKHMPCQRFEREQCNQLWQTDFKGDFLLGDGTRCFPLTILDDHSRFSILIDPKDSPSGVKESFIRVFQEYGLPDSVLSDNGPQFAGPHKGISLFERFLMDLDIQPIHGRLVHPQTQGKIERFHRTMKQESLRLTPANMAEAKKQLENWRWIYNEVRPHHALNMKTPASVYVPSTRSYCAAKPYFYQEGAKLIKVNNWGYLRFASFQLFLSESMADTRVEIRYDENGSFSIIYRNYKIASVNPIDGKILNRHIRRL